MDAILSRDALLRISVNFWDILTSSNIRFFSLQKSHNDRLIIRRIISSPSWWYSGDWWSVVKYCDTNISQKSHIYLWIGLSPCPVTVTTRIIPFLVGNPYKPSFVTVTGRGDNPIYKYTLYMILMRGPWHLNFNRSEHTSSLTIISCLWLAFFGAYPRNPRITKSWSLGDLLFKRQLPTDTSSWGTLGRGFAISWGLERFNRLTLATYPFVTTSHLVQYVQVFLCHPELSSAPPATLHLYVHKCPTCRNGNNDLGLEFQFFMAHTVKHVSIPINNFSNNNEHLKFITGKNRNIYKEQWWNTFLDKYCRT